MDYEYLKEEIRYLKRLVYGSKSEKRKKIDLPPNQPTLFDGQDEIKEIQDQEANKEALLSQMESENSNSNDPSTPPKPPSKSSAKRGGRRPLRTIPPHVKTTNPEATGCKPPRNGYESV